MPAAIWTISTLTVTTNPVSPTLAPTIAASTVSAVPGRIRPAPGELEARARFGRDDADEGAGDAAEDGKDPQAPLHILANTEAKAPAHPERLAALAVSARASPAGWTSWLSGVSSVVLG